MPYALVDRAAQAHLFLCRGHGIDLEAEALRRLQCANHHIHRHPVVQCLGGDAVADLLEIPAHGHHISDAHEFLDSFGGQPQVHKEVTDHGLLLAVVRRLDVRRLDARIQHAGQITRLCADGHALGNHVARVVAAQTY